MPSPCHFDNLIGDIAGRAIGAHANNARNPPEPFPLVGGVAARAADERLDGLVSRKLGDVTEAVNVLRRRGDRPRQRAPDLVLDAAREHRVRPLLDPPVEDFLRHVEPDDKRRVPHVGGPESILLGSQGRSELRELQRPDHAAPVVRMDDGRRLRVALGEERVRSFGPEPLVRALPALARPGARRRRKLEIRERRA